MSKQKINPKELTEFFDRCMYGDLGLSGLALGIALLLVGILILLFTISILWTLLTIYPWLSVPILGVLLALWTASEYRKYKGLNK